MSPWDELRDAEGKPRPAAAEILAVVDSVDIDDLYVLEDKLRVPSGVSYVLENRAVAKRAFPEVFAAPAVRRSMTETCLASIVVGHGEVAAVPDPVDGPARSSTAECTRPSMRSEPGRRGVPARRPGVEPPA